MKFLIFPIFLISSILTGQENNLVLNATLTQLAPVVSTTTSLQGSASMLNNPNGTRDLDNPRENVNYNKYTIHPPSKALTLSEFKKAQAENILINSSEMTERKNIKSDDLII
ncbi:MAG: hypothetical protein WBA61_01320 [Aequorivita sp.]